MAKSKIHWSGPGSLQCAVSRSRGLHAARHLSQDAQSFLGLSKTSPDFCCATCAKAARLALAAESAPKPSSRCTSEGCGSHAINPGQSGRDDASDLDLCDVCYWRKRAQPEPRPIAEASYPSRVLAWFPSLSGWRIVRAGCWPVHESNAYHLPTHFLPLPPSPEVT